MALGAFAGCVDPDATSKGADGRDPRKIDAATKPIDVYPGQYRFDARFSQVLVDGIYAALPPVHEFISSEIDGADIEIGFWLPDVPPGTKVPVIVHASPYHRPAGAVTTQSGMKNFLVSNFLPHGYAVGAVAVRGTANSGGCMDLMGVKENGDLDQAITWFGEQPWSNGNVAMIGVSYDGSTPWTVASFGNPHLKTIVPISGVPDLYGLMFRNGSAETRGPAALNALYYEYSFGPTDANRDADKRITGAACPESLTGFSAAMYSGVYGERDPLGWWAERNRKPATEANYKGSVLSVQGFQDWNVDPHMVIPWAQELADEQGIYVKQMLGQWGHSSPDNRLGDNNPAKHTRYDWAEILLHWFDYWLKGVQTDLGPRAQVQDDKGNWRNEDSYPPHDAKWTTYHLSEGNRLTLEPDIAGSALLLPNPGDLQGGPCESLRQAPCWDVDFSLPVEEDLHIGGLPRLHVTVSPKGPTGHIAGYLWDVSPDGSAKRVGWTMINLRFADGTETSRPLVPNQPILAKMEFQPLDVLIPAGHQLRVTIWEVEENDRLPAIPPQAVELLYGGSVQSTLELPILERTEADYFLPPWPPGIERINEYPVLK
jgi:putative CocE/NonD family hydrolase